MSFKDRIAAARPTAAEARARRWIYVPYDQLTVADGLLAGADPAAVGLIFVESAEKASRRPYHKKKLALLLSNERHFALEQAAAGFSVLYLRGEQPIASQLEQATRRWALPSIQAMEPAERELRQELATAQLPLALLPNRLFLSSADELVAACPGGPPFRMDAFYRTIRRRLGVLMAGGKPVGGRFSFDGENRKSWPGQPAAPPRFSVPPDELTAEVLELVAQRFPSHFGTLDGFDLPCSAGDAEALWQHVRRHCLPWFGPFEDAISLAAPDLFHSKVSALVNLGRLSVRRLTADVERAYHDGELPLASAEGFIRQLIGWREFVRHVHTLTDGFRSLEPTAAPNALSARQPLPAVYWNRAPSGLHCLDSVVAQVHAEGYSHHITRLMVLSNFANLLGVEPRQLCDWFWFAYVDAYDWVVEPNVLGMGTFADGGMMTTKPYVAGSAYLDRMSDACKSCQFSPKAGSANACPLTPMYWTFLARHRQALATVERMKLPLASASKRPPEQQAADAAVTAAVQAALGLGQRLPATVVSDCGRGAG